MAEYDPVQPGTPEHDQLLGKSEAPPRPPVVASFLVRVTLRANAYEGGSEHDIELARRSVPTNEGLERIVADAVYAGTPYFSNESITVSSERVDK